MSMSDFFTREAANEGVKLPLYLPSGEKSDHFIMIRGIDSDEFRKAKAKAMRDIAFISTLNKDEQEDVMEKAQLEQLAALVISWSFEEECNQENIFRMFREAPQVMDAINQLSARRNLFFAQRLSSSLLSQTANLSSTESQKDKNQA